MGWAPRVRTEFHELRATLVHLGLCFDLLQDCHLLRSNFPEQFASRNIDHAGVQTPVRRPVWGRRQEGEGVKYYSLAPPRGGVNTTTDPPLIKMGASTRVSC
jgi:hypothetical protein